jgi:tRNA threonylcarbamoyladenosine biosynthesis protein TsaB
MPGLSGAGIINGCARNDPHVKLLAFDTSTGQLYVAVHAGASGSSPLEYASAGGAQSSTALIPAIMRLMADAGLRLPELDAIVFGRGPGSFTGLRTACSVAQGLGFGANVPVLPVDTLLAVAEDARHRTGTADVMAVLDARMDEVYGARYVHEGGSWRQRGPFVLAAPQALDVPPGCSLAGNAFCAYGDRLPVAAARIEAMPTAAALLRLAPALLAAGGAQPAGRATPLYIRDKVAQTTDERAAARALSANKP